MATNIVICLKLVQANTYTGPVPIEDMQTPFTPQKWPNWGKRYAMCSNLPKNLSYKILQQPFAATNKLREWFIAAAKNSI